jgi:hypothetical protein
MFRLLLIAGAGAVIYWSLPLAVTDGSWYWAALMAAIFAFTRRKDAPVTGGGCFYLLVELASVAGLVWALPQAVISPENTTVWAVFFASLWVYAWQAEDSFWLQLEKDWQMQLAGIAAAAVGLYWLVPVCANAKADWLQWGVMFLCLWVYTRRPEAPEEHTTEHRSPPLEDAGVPARVLRPSPSLRETARV